MYYDYFPPIQKERGMTSRERVLAALQHKEADKIPVDCGAERSTTIQAIAYNNLKEYLGIEGGETKINDTVQQCIIPEQWFLDMFQIDAVDLARTFADEPDDWKEWNLPDGSPAKIQKWIRMERRHKMTVIVNEKGEEICKMPDSAYYFDQSVWPLMGIHKKNFDDLPQYMEKVMWSYVSDPMWSKANDPKFYTMLRENAKKLYEETEYAIIMPFGGSIFEYGQYLYRTDELLMNLITNKDEIKMMVGKLTDLYMEKLPDVLDAVSPYVQIIRMGDDLGLQSGPMISPELYREIYFPHHKRMFQTVKEKTDLYIYFHTCGAMSEFIPDLIEAGVDILNPVQITTEGMAPERLKREFGKDIVFWGGGCDTQHVLPHGTPEDVRKDVRKNSEVFMKDGGFVFNQVHNILADVPPENIYAMLDEVNKIHY